MSEDLPQRTATEQVLLTRLICELGDVEGEQAVIAGTEIVLSNEPEKGVPNAPRLSTRGGNFRGVLCNVLVCLAVHGSVECDR